MFWSNFLARKDNVDANLMDALLEVDDSVHRVKSRSLKYFADRNLQLPSRTSSRQNPFVGSRSRHPVCYIQPLPQLDQPTPHQHFRQSPGVFFFRWSPYQFIIDREGKKLLIIIGPLKI